jgi:hypothetical protein
MEKGTTLNIRVDPELKRAIDAWRETQPVDRSYGAAFRYAMRKVLLEDGFLGDKARKQEPPC